MQGGLYDDAVHQSTRPRQFERGLRAIGGWKSNIVSRYVHLAAEDAKGALEKLAEKIGQ